MTAFVNPFTGQPIPASPIIPEVFEKSISTEDKILKLAAWLTRTLNHYVTFDDLKAAMAAEDIKIDDLRRDMTIADTKLRQLIEALAIQEDTYNPTVGDYQPSQQTNRDIYRELAVFGARVSQMATLTCAEAAKTNCLEMAVIGNYTVFGNKEPRVTPRAKEQG